MTPAATKVALVATLAATAFATAVSARRLASSDVDGRGARVFLIALSLLFATRVAGQVLVALRAPRWLPPMGQWNLLPYRLLLPIQVVFLAVMAAIDLRVYEGEDPLSGTGSSTGHILIGMSVVYAAAMIVRYCVRMHRRPGERWFGGAIPIVFHLVLAAYLFALGAYHAAS